MHDDRLMAVLQRLREVHLTLNKKKCTISQSHAFLGQILTGSGVQSDPEKVAAITQMKEPENESEVRQFLGMAKQLSKFTPHLTNMTQPLRDLLSKDHLWVWCPQKEVLKTVQKVLTNSPVVAQFDPTLL